MAFQGLFLTEEFLNSSVPGTNEFSLYLMPERTAL
jgi:hypothetical protein